MSVLCNLRKFSQQLASQHAQIPLVLEVAARAPWMWGRGRVTRRRNFSAAESTLPPSAKIFLETFVGLREDCPEMTPPSVKADLFSRSSLERHAWTERLPRHIGLHFPLSLNCCHPMHESERRVS